MGRLGIERTRTNFRNRHKRSLRGFSFIELLMVMGGMAILMGLAVGFLGNIGGATHLAQAKALMTEAAYECIGRSNGGGRAALSIREASDGGLQMRAVTASSVLTHQFEDLQFASGARSPQVMGTVELVDDGRTGRAAKFTRGGYIEFGAESGFAMTEGLELEAWIQPGAGAQQMVIIRGANGSDELVYAVELVRDGQGESYKVQLQLKVRGALESDRTPGLMKTLRTEGAPIIADGTWQHIAVRFDGVAASFRVNGIDIPAEAKGKRRESATVDESEMFRIVIPPSGVVKLTVSAQGNPYKGLIDNLQLRGVFRVVEQNLPGRLIVAKPKLPIRVEYVNGRLSAEHHTTDVVIQFKDDANPNNIPLRMTLGMYGTVEAKFTRRGVDPVQKSAGASGKGAESGSTLERMKKGGNDNGDEEDEEDDK